MNSHFWNTAHKYLPLQPRPSSLAALAWTALGASVFFASCMWFRKREPVSSNDERTGTKASKKGLGLESMAPGQFQYPDITPHPSNPLEIQPIPYRPFRTGEYHVTMGIRSMPWDEWIELDNQYEAYHRIRGHRISTRGKNAVRVLPENPGFVASGAAAAVELVHEIAEYLSRRYPSMFRVVRHSAEAEGCYDGWYDLSAIKSITIIPLKETHELPLSMHATQDDGEEALRIAALLVQEDIALMVEGKDGRYYFQAGAILVPGFWRMQDKIGLPLDEIHNSGNVPRYKEKLQMSMERFFQRLAVNKPVARNNYFFQVIQPSETVDGQTLMDPEELAWAESSHGPEDEYTHSFPAEQPNRPEITTSNVRLRTERQTLRRLPRSGAIVFGIRTYLTPIVQIGKEPGVAKRLAGALRGWGEDIGVYKGRFTGGWWDEVLRYLDDCAVGEEEVFESRYPL